jgi:hypothetical protein
VLSATRGTGGARFVGAPQGMNFENMG